MLTNDVHRGIRQYTWAENSKSILYLQDTGGDEDYHLFLQPIDGGETIELTPYQGVKAENLITDQHFPDEVLVGLNKRDPKEFDMHRINLKSGEVTMDTQNPGDVISWLTDPEFRIRASLAFKNTDASQVVRVRDDEQSEWRDIITWPKEEDGYPLQFTKDGQSLHVLSSLGNDTTRLIRISQQDGKEEEFLIADPKVDVDNILLDENTRKVQAVSFNYLRSKWKVLDSDVADDFEILQSLEDGLADFKIMSQSQDNSVWVVTYTRDNGSSVNYLYDRKMKKAEFLFANQPQLNDYTLAKMEPVVITARDGVELPSYLTLPVLEEGEPKNLPMVLYVHGGPWRRDNWGFEPTTQWLANRGYAVLQVNYRASSGYGKKFVHLGDKQWGANMQNDLTDAVKWAIDQGYADPKKVAIFGGSYGGYATLAGLTFTPELYCCGVDIVGVSNVSTFMKSIPSYWEMYKQYLVERVGDVENDEQFNRKISPLFHIDKIQAPLIIAQGANDPRVKKAESDQIYEALKAKGLQVEYYLYEDEGHGFARPPNRLDFYSRTEQFLASILGGRAEEFQLVDNTSVQVIHEHEN
eukprot:TRINITY_DN56091_c0_g1_i4.p1 TRINITY_DN56091_c0_g1~~TRINITY_DN56091_c0_g1_i4.p1  ORF type:complete len:664 (-),score=71.74 TRINITY_DN56091_c0_g1_i4:392-2134(-)